MNKCLMVHNTRRVPKLIPDGAGGFIESYRMRPSTPTPDKHWSSMVLGRFGEASEYVQVCGSEIPEGGPEIWISRHLQKIDPEGFDWLMRFIKSEGLAFTPIESECAKCSGNKTCVAIQ